MKLYKYSGTIEELAVELGRISYIKLFDVTDFDKAPTRLEVFGALGKYIEAIELTDAEERYIKSDWYFDSNLYLRRIELAVGEDGRPAKIITQSPDNIEQWEICGLQLAFWGGILRGSTLTCIGLIFVDIYVDSSYSEIYSKLRDRALSEGFATLEELPVPLPQA